MVRDFIIYLLAFFNIYLIIYFIFFFKKKRGPERGEGVKNWDGTRQDEIP